jgi:hypothetical protein
VIHKEGLCPSSGDNNRLMMLLILLDGYLAEFIQKIHEIIPNEEPANKTVYVIKKKICGCVKTE